MGRPHMLHALSKPPNYKEYYGVAKFVKASLLMWNNMGTMNHLLANNVPLALDVILEYYSLTMCFC